MARVIIIGAGVAGLATAARLADFGHHVTVYEREPAVGGRVRPRVHDGYTFHIDPTPLTLPAVYRDLFRKTGRPLERVVELAPLDPAVRYRFADGSHVDLPHASRAGAAAAFDAALGPGRGDAWLRVVDHGRAVWDTLRTPYLDAEPSGRDLVRLVRPATLRALRPWRSLRSIATELVTDPRQRFAIEHAGSGDPRWAPALLTVVPYLHETFGRWSVVGGHGALAAALADRARERGAIIHTGTGVAEIVADGRSVAGVRLGDETQVAADVVVAAGAPGLVRLPTRSARLPSRPAAAFTVHLGLRGPVPCLPAHTVSFPADTGAAFDDIVGSDPRPARDPVIDIHVADDPALRPPGDTAAWTLVVEVPGPDRFDWGADARAEGYADHLINVLATRGLDVTQRIVQRVVISPLDRMRESGSPGTCGWPPGRGARTLSHRPRNDTGVRGLYRAGSTAYPGPGLALVGLSSLMVADRIGRA